MSDVGFGVRKMFPGSGSGGLRAATPFPPSQRVTRKVVQASTGYAFATFDSGDAFTPLWTDAGDLASAGWAVYGPFSGFEYLGASTTVAFDIDLTYTFPAGASGNGWLVLTNYTTSDQIFGTVTASAPGDVVFHCDGTIAFSTGDVLTVSLGGSFAQLPTNVSGVFP